MSSNIATPWGGFIKIDNSPAEGDFLVGDASGSFALSSQISGASLAPNSVDTAQIADGAVTTAKIPSGAITTAQLIDQGIITTKLADGAVTAPKMPDGVITTTKISDGAITTGKIQANAITTNLLAAGSVTADTIAAGSISTDKILANAITTLTINAQAITTDKITVGGVETNNIAQYAVSRVAAASSNTGTASVNLTTVPGTSICILGLFNGVLNTSSSSGTLNLNVNGTNVDSATIYADASASPVLSSFLTPQGYYTTTLYASAYNTSGSPYYGFPVWGFSGNRNLYPRTIQYNYLVPAGITSATVQVVASVTSDVSILVWGLQR